MASKSVIAFLMMVNLSMFAFVSTNATATCPDLNVCLDIADSLLNVQFGTHSRTECCKLLKGIVDADAALCLCTSLKTTSLGSAVGSALGLLNSLLGGLTGPILDKELLAIFNACGLNAPTDYHCAA
ncbi:pEARLI1-like lipid transfer protein 1 [Bienertia sinuspersici]